MEISSALGRVRGRIEAAAHRAGRSPAEIQLVAVTKGFGAEAALAALAAGLAALGESRVKEAQAKIEAVHAAAVDLRPTWHLIGHLQTNKAGLAARLFDWVHSVDSLRVAEALGARRRQSPLNILVEIKTSREPSKSGLAPEQALDLVPAIAAVEGVVVRGLMTVPALDPDPGVARRAFRSLRTLASRLGDLRDPGVRMEHLSMGMSDDFEIAIEEGATMIRLGTALFGERPQR